MDDDLDLTDETIAAALDRASRAVCAPNDKRCGVFPDSPAMAVASCNPDGWCVIGWVVAEQGRRAWDARLNVRTGEGRLRRRPTPK